MVYTIISSYSKLPTGWMACLPFTAAQVNWWPPHQMENSRFECYIFIWLVVDLLLWKIWKSVGIIVPNIWKNKKCSEPPTSYIWHCFTLFSLFLSLSYYSHFDDMIISFFFFKPSVQSPSSAASPPVVFLPSPPWSHRWSCGEQQKHNLRRNAN